MHNSRELVRTAINNLTDHKIHRIPKGEILIDDSVIAKELKCQTVGFTEKWKFINNLGLDIFCLNPYNDCPPNQLPDAQDIKWPFLTDWVSKSGLFIFAMIDGPFGWGSRVFGYMDFLTLPLKDPLIFDEFVKKVEKLNIQLIKVLISQGVDGIIIADDLAYQKGLLVNRKFLEGTYFSSLFTQVQEISTRGITAFFHSDGNTLDIIDNLIDIGFNGLQCLEKNSGMDIKDLKIKYGRHLCFWGGLDAHDIMSSCDPVYLETLVKDISFIDDQKGVILGTNSGIFDGLDIRNLMKVYSYI